MPRQIARAEPTYGRGGSFGARSARRPSFETRKAAMNCYFRSAPRLTSFRAENVAQLDLPPCSGATERVAALVAGRDRKDVAAVFGVSLKAVDNWWAKRPVGGRGGDW